MKKVILILWIALTPIFALNIPENSKDDRRVTFANYNANDVVRVNAQAGFVSVIEFAKEENIINLATGFSEGWDLTAKGNLLFITPKAVITKQNVSEESENGEQKQTQKDITIQPNQSQWKTNLVVSTNYGMYVFELNLNSSSNLYKLTFVYPQKELEKMKEISKAIEEKTDQAIVDSALNRTAIPRNWEFYAKVTEGSETIMPNYAYDDGVFTYLGFDNTKTFPSVFGVDNGAEEILNTHIKKDGNYDVLIIQKTMSKIVLRSGDKVVGILNKGYGKNPPEKTQETSNDEMVERMLKNAQEF